MHMSASVVSGPWLPSFANGLAPGVLSQSDFVEFGTGRGEAGLSLGCFRNFWEMSHCRTGTERVLLIMKDMFSTVTCRVYIDFCGIHLMFFAALHSTTMERFGQPGCMDELDDSKIHRVANITSIQNLINWPCAEAVSERHRCHMIPTFADTTDIIEGGSLYHHFQLSWYQLWPSRSSIYQDAWSVRSGAHRSGARGYMEE